MMNKKKIGLDVWFVSCDMVFFLQMVKNHDLEIYDLQIKENGILFYAPIWERYTIQHCFPHLERKKTTGMLGYALRCMRKTSFILSILLVCLLWYTLSHTIFEIKIKGEQRKSRALISQTLKDMGYTTPFYDSNPQKMKIALKKKLENDIAWLEVEKQGSRYHITYTPKEFAKLPALGYEELIAQEDGVLAYFDIDHGNKVHKVNDFVHVGDVLVSNILEDSKGKKEEINVLGRVYAYTWRDVSVTMDKNNLPKSFQYFDLLLEARGEVAKELRKGDKIYKENILQFSTDMGKIKMNIHYTLYKDITTPQ